LRELDGLEGEKTAEARTVARTEALFRSVNERIEATNGRFGVGFEQIKFVCECADEHCMQRITLAVRSYEDVRRIPTHFIVTADHVDREFERVVERLDGYVVVEKFGEAGKESLKLDERRRPIELHL
jgi:hypothetical protein